MQEIIGLVIAIVLCSVVMLAALLLIVLAFAWVWPFVRGPIERILEWVEGRLEW